jgi:hypothetical protein
LSNSTFLDAFDDWQFMTQVQLPFDPDTLSLDGAVARAAGKNLIVSY